MEENETDEKELIKFLKIIKELSDGEADYEESAFFISLAPN